MDALRRIERGQVEAFGDLQHLKHGEAGGIRRRLGDAEAAIGDGDRILRLRLGCFQVAFVYQHAGRAHASREALCQSAAVEGVGAVLGDFLQRAREIGLADQCGELRHADIQVAEKHAARTRIGGEYGAHIGREMPVMVGDGEAFTRVLDGGGA